MSNVCPKGHFSSDPDYCSECGTPLQAASSIPFTPRSNGSATRTGPTTPTACNDTANCPDCMTLRPAHARFCEVCRFDFVAKKSFSGLGSSDLVAAATQPTAAISTIAPTVVASSAVTTLRLLLRIVVDPMLNKEPDLQSPCPVNARERIFHLDLDENTLGRQYEGNGVHPEIVVHDPGISRRHLKFLREDDGGFSVLELGSANGTECNAKRLEPGVVARIQPSDQLTLGMWTRIHVQAR